MKIRVVGAELFRVDRRTDVTKLIVTFCNFANAPVKSHSKAYVLVHGVYDWLSCLVLNRGTAVCVCVFGSR